MGAAPGNSRQREKLDLAAFSAYLLGAVIPLGTLAWVADRYVLPTLDDRLDTLGLIGLIVSLAALSLGSFLILRRSTHRSLLRMDLDNARLASLLRTSTALADCRESQAALETAASAAQELTHADAAFVFVGGSAGTLPSPAWSHGERAAELFEIAGPALAELLRPVYEEARPVLRGAEAGAPGEKKDGAAIAVPIAGERGVAGALVALRARGAEAFDTASLDALATLAALAAVALRNADLLFSQRNFFAHVTEILSTALDNHLDYHRGHGKRVAALANRIGRELGLGADALQRLHFGALLHDIGMLKLERNQKMNAKACEKHSVIGARMLAPILLWQEIAPIVHAHHERWDGRGYPDGLAGESIPLEARVIALADAYDSVASEQSYRVALSREEAIREIEECSGTQFDPRVTAAFVALTARGEIGEDD
jgi:putative nucleotidyltransferase with HDIG domain